LCCPEICAAVIGIDLRNSRHDRLTHWPRQRETGERSKLPGCYC
jgi:hypothetical protein